MKKLYYDKDQPKLRLGCFIAIDICLVVSIVLCIVFYSILRKDVSSLSSSAGLFALLLVGVLITLLVGIVIQIIVLVVINTKYFIQRAKNNQKKR